MLAGTRVEPGAPMGLQAITPSSWSNPRDRNDGSVLV